MNKDICDFSGSCMATRFAEMNVSEKRNKESLRPTCFSISRFDENEKGSVMAPLRVTAEYPQVSVYVR